MGIIKKNQQRIVHPKNGDCFRACMSSLLGLENDEFLPNISEEGWFVAWHNFLAPLGLNLIYEEKACWREGYWIASVPSKNFSGVNHAIVMYGTEVFWDPSTKEKYQEGESLLGKDLVLGGWFLEVTDPSKIMFTFHLN